MQGTNGIEARGLVRQYAGRGQSGRTALAGVSFEVPYGQVVGLLGPNGAGKTSCVKVLTTLLTPTSGEALVAGANVVTEPKLVQRRCGVSFGGDGGLYGRLSAADNLRFFGAMYGLGGRELKRRAGELLELVRLADRAGSRVETFSRGMRQRLHIARVLMHDPRVLLLDEPSSGLDPESSHELRGLVASLRDQGRAVLVTTHDLVEAEAICDQVLILVNGRITRQVSPVRLREEAARSIGTIVNFRTSAPLSTEFIESLPGILTWERQDGGYQVHCADGTAAAAFLTRNLDDRVSGLEIIRPSLEDAYLELAR
jgi:ABC-2 type transport system ATP-binding protein